MPEFDPRSVISRSREAPKKRSLTTVPYVEISGGRLMGVVSSSSDWKRMYCNFVEAGTGNYYCSTNNNRRCGGLRGGGCKHIFSMVDQAIAQYGAAEVAKALQVPGDPKTYRNGRSMLSVLPGTETKEPAAIVFARFLDYLRFFELPASTEPAPEMGFFVTG